MNIKSKLYREINNCSLSDYCIFNQTKNDIEKNEFLKLTLNALDDNTWFDVSRFADLGERPIDKDFTQIAFADNETKKEEFDALSKTFKEEEIEHLIEIIANLKSYGVYPIKELMDNHDEANKKTSFMKRAFFRPFLFRRKT
jgi:hypothetical protein